jgi:hypothetical protein
MGRPLGRASRYLPEPFSNWAAPLLVAGAIGLLAACASHGASVEGQVFEAVNPEAPMSQRTRFPSADAYVIVHWQGTVPQPGHAGSVCLHAAIGKTDERGRFEVSGWWAAPKVYPVIQREPAVMVYKPGFDQQSDDRDPGAPVVRTLVRSKLAAEQRVALLSMYAEAGCRDDDTFKTIPLGDPQGIAARFYRALYEEAQALGPLPPALHHHLASLREKAGVPQPAEPPWQIRAIPPQGARPVVPAPAVPAGRP